MVRRYLKICLIFGIAVGLLGCTIETQDTTVQDEYLRVTKARKAMDTPAERVKITKAFLDKYPSSAYTAAALSAIYWYQGTEMDDKPGALAYAETIRYRIDDPSVAADVDKLLIEYYGDAGKAVEMLDAATRLEAAGKLDFDDHWGVIKGAINAQEWVLARDFCAKARRLATTGAVKAEFGGRETTDEEIAETTAERQGMLLTGDGWARANLQEVTEALADFAEADRLLPRYYFDIPEYDLYVYWGKTLLKNGDYDGAIDRFALNGLVMQNDEALAGLKQAYAGTYGSGDGFDQWAEALHRKIAPKITDFDMPDYAGERHKLADIQGDITLVGLWFPT